MTKEEKFMKVADAVFQTILSKGIPGLTISRVADLSQVSRSWVYKYVGKKDDQLLEFAVDCLGKYYGEFGRQKTSKTPDDWVKDFVRGIDRMFDSTLEFPAILHIYYRYSGTPNQIGKRIRELEAEYIKTRAADIVRCLKVPPGSAHEQSEMLLALRMGLAHRWLISTDHSAKTKKIWLEHLTRWLESIVEISIRTRSKKPG